MRELFRYSVSEIGEMSGEPLPKADLVITRGSSIRKPHANSLLFVKNLTSGLCENLSKRVMRSLILVPADADADLIAALRGGSVIAPVRNPRLSYARIMNAAIASHEPYDKYHEIRGAIIAETAIVSESARVEPGSFIDHDVVIAADACILSGARICAYSEVGAKSIIRQNAVVGGQGFGFERDEAGRPVRIPHFGGVMIGMNSEIGAAATVCSGTIDPTVVGDDVKIDNHVHIAHNCVIGNRTMIAACAELSGSVGVGEGCWISPNISVLEGKRIGDGAWVGMGSVVMKDVPDGDVVAGNPARSIRAIVS